MVAKKRVFDKRVGRLREGKWGHGGCRLWLPRLALTLTADQSQGRKKTRGNKVFENDCNHCQAGFRRGMGEMESSRNESNGLVDHGCLDRGRQHSDSQGCPVGEGIKGSLTSKSRK